MGTAINTAFILVMMINVIMGLSQYSINQMTNGEGQTFNGCGAIFREYTKDNATVSSGVDYSTLNSRIGASDQSTVFGTTGVFGVVDWIGKATKFITDMGNTFTQIASGPYCMLNSMELDATIVGYISIMWYGLMLLLFIGFILGR
jgi:hypothetical protein